jgi:malate dehydrogenase
MREVAIVGAGELGGLIAHVLARRDAADRVRLIDERGRIAEGKALDISQAAPVERFAASVAGSTDLSAAIGCDVVVIADRAVPPGTTSQDVDSNWRGDEAVALIRRVRATAPQALVVCAGLEHRELVDRAVRELHVPRGTIVGSGSEAFAAAAQAMVALDLDVSARDVALPVLGIPPTHIVIAWEEATVGGLSLKDLLPNPARRRLDRRIAAVWPLVGPYALATAACKVIEALTGISRRPVTCFVAPDERDANRTRTAALPVKLDARGLVEVLVPGLSAAERVALDNALLR